MLVPPELHHHHPGDRFGVLQVEKPNQKGGRTVSCGSTMLQRGASDSGPVHTETEPKSLIGSKFGPHGSSFPACTTCLTPVDLGGIAPGPCSVGSAHL